MSAMGEPIVKWVGGKTRLLPELLSRMPFAFGSYYEPFAGGAALFFRLASGRDLFLRFTRSRAVLSDANRDLINLYRIVARRTDAIIHRLGEYKRRHSSSWYYQTRERWNRRRTEWSRVDRAAAFVYLNKTCFNGLWRVNRAGHFNVPMGRYDDPPICASDTLRAASVALRRAELRCGHYRDAVADARAGDFLYFDPPYDPVTKTASFTSYTQGAFGPDDQRELAELARSLVARGCKVMLSNSDTAFVRSLYKGFRIDEVSCGRELNSNAAKRGKVAEVLILGGEPT